MIRVHRGAEPSILTAKGQKWLDAWRDAVTPGAKAKALTKYAHPQVVDALRDLFHGKCAYCESKIEAVTWGHVDHYRPKSRFPEKAFDWDNLLWACPRCNSGCKGDQFPEAPDGGPIVNPCEDEPGDHLRFEWDPVARLANVWGETERGRTTEDVLQLNRPDLQRERSSYVLHLAALAGVAGQSAEAQALLDEAKADDSKYAAFARALDG